MTLRRLPVLLAFVFVTSSAVAQDVPKGERIFICGHSFHAYVGVPLTEAAKAAGIPGHEIVGKQYLGGSKVSQHWDLPDAKNDAKKALRTGKVDVLTLSPHTQLPDEGIEKFVALALENNPATRVVIQASWYPWDTPNAPKAFKNEDRDVIKVADLREAYAPFEKTFYEQMKSLNMRYAAKLGRDVITIVPIGRAVMTLREKIADGQVPGISKQSSLFLDPIGHPRPPIAVLNAYCHYAVIYRRSPVGLPPAPSLIGEQVPGWDEKFDRLLQEIAWQTVTTTSMTGVEVKK